MIDILIYATKNSNLTFDEIFKIVYDYGLVDYVGNITTEFFEDLNDK